MPHPRPTGRRAVRRACRLVSPGRAFERRAPFAPQFAYTYHLALSRVRDMRALFPDFYQEHIAQRQLTPRALLGSVCAFLSLVNRDLFAIEDCIVLDVPADPLRALRYTEDGSRDPLLELEEAAHWLCQPRPELYGVGTESILDDETPQQLLTLALWHLCRETNWAIGVDVGDVIGFSFVGEDIAEFLVKLPVLPRGTMMENIIAAIKLPPWSDKDEFDELICYAFARTDNPMANTTNYEVDMYWNGEVDSSWKDVREIAETAQEARQIVARYNTWAQAIAKNPRRELRKLTRALHTAVEATALTKPRRTKTLAEILLDMPIEEAEEVPV